MTEKNFSELLNAAFDHGTVHFKHLEKFLKSLIVRLNLNNDEIISYSTKNDAVLKSIPSTNTLKQGLCKKDEGNPLENMINAINLTKRIELALEISVQKLTSLMQTILSEQRRREEESINSDNEILNEHDLISKTQILKEQNDSNISDQKTITNSNQHKSSHKKCCSKKTSSSNIETFGVVQVDFLKDLPQTQTLPKCSFNRLEKSCKKRLDEIQSDDKFANLCDLRELERHFKEQNDDVFSLINSNFYYLQQQVCTIEKQLGKVGGQLEDIFFACEQNGEKIDEAISSTNEFNAKIFCLKSDVKGLLDDSREFKLKFDGFNEKCEKMNIVKANKSYVDEQLKINLEIMSEELVKKVDVNGYEEFVDALRMRLVIHEEFQADVKKSIICLMAKIDEKLTKNELKKFKSLVGTLFDDFVKDLRILLFNISQNALSMGTSQCLQTNLNCITCNSKVSMATEFPQLTNSSIMFKNKLSRVKAPKKSSKSGVYCGGVKNFLKPIQKKKQLPCNQSSLLQFPPRSQQCFIISKDNTVFQADRLKCLLNSKYKEL